MNCSAVLRLEEVLPESNVSTLPVSYVHANGSICCSTPVVLWN